MRDRSTTEPRRGQGDRTRPALEVVLTKFIDTSGDKGRQRSALAGPWNNPSICRPKQRICSRCSGPVTGKASPSEKNISETVQSHLFSILKYVLRPFNGRQLDLNIQTALAIHGRESRHQESETRLKQTINRLEDLTHLMEAVFNSMDEGVAAVDENRMLMFYNASALRIGGEYPDPVEKDSDNWAEKYDVFHPDGQKFRSVDESPLGLALKGEASDEVEVFVRNELKPQGVHIRVNSRPLMRKTGVSKGAVLVFGDITKLKQAEAELEQTLSRQRNQAQLMEAVFSSISDGVIVANAEGGFTFFNPSAEHTIGLSMLDVPPDQWAEKNGIFFRDRKTRVPTVQLPLVRAIGGQATEQMETFIRNEKRPDGVYLSVSGRPLQGMVDGHAGGVIIFRDVTERVLAEETLERAFRQGRLEIVDTILHNIGNAINSVTTGIETVRRNLVFNRVGRRLSALAAALRAHGEDWIDYLGKDPQGQKVVPFIIELADSFSIQNEELVKTVGRVRDRADHIADIVRTQKALASPNMDRKDIDLNDALFGAFRVLRDWLNKRGIKTNVDCENAPQEIRIRESQFHQILVNLVKNSLEAIDDLAATGELHESPRIWIKASVEKGLLNLEVSDNGIGIDKIDTKVLFSPGYTTKGSGTGLGLHSAANFVIASGGQIKALSEGIGKGTTMLATLPLSTVASRSRAGDPRLPADGEGGA